MTVHATTTYSEVSDPPATRRVAASDWERSYVRRLRISDFVVIVLSVLAAQVFWVRSDAVNARTSWIPIDYSVVSVLLILGWFSFTTISESRNVRIVGIGSDEYKRVINGSIWTYGILAMVAYLLQLEISRGYFLTSLPIGLGLLLLSRWGWRKWLRHQRRNGGFMHRAIVAGAASHVSTIVREIMAAPESGYQVVGVCLDKSASLPDGDKIEGVSTLGDLDAVLPSMDIVDADTVILTSTRGLTPRRLRAISWDLEPGHRHLVMSPGLVDVAGPRIATRQVGGLPLIHVETPRFSGPARAVKYSFDFLGSIVAVVIFSPVMLTVAALVKITSPGPVFYKQERIGLNGKPFRIFKFRTMRVGADKELKALLEKQGTSTQPLFKVENDPRITPVGRVLRKYSLDELPQFFNVLNGSMSLVGPRPQIADEVALYDEAAARRLLVKPGITGLWQVSGRSDLDWNETVRLDLFYVENWSLAADLVILWKTVRAVLARDGAY